MDLRSCHFERHKHKCYAANRNAYYLIRSLDWPSRGAGGPERRKISADICRIERRARESAHLAIDGFDRFGTESGVVEIGPKHGHGGCERCRAERGLPPTHHLRKEPGGLDGVGSR